MALIAPFCGLRFNPEKVGKLEDVVTPPYDVINKKTEEAFKARNPYNMIKLDISKSPGPVKDADTRYAKAKNYFNQWQQDEILVRDNKPAIYLYFIDYVLSSGRRLRRKGLVSLVEITDFTEGVIKPHEETFGTVTSDRLRLMDTCQAQFSQIFSLYSDKDGKIMKKLEEACTNDPICSVRDADGAVHSIWSVTDPDSLKSVQNYFKDKSIYIADGHHRYSTALTYKNRILEEQGKLDSESPYNFVVMYLCAMEDPGLSVLPTHRLLYLPDDSLHGKEAKTMDSLIDILSKGFDYEEIKIGTREVLISEVLSRMDEERSKQIVFGLYHAGEDRCLLLALKKGAMQKLSDIDRPIVLRDLDVVVLSDLIIAHFLGLDDARCEEENLIHYFHDPDEALDVAVKRSLNQSSRTPLLFLMNNTEVQQVKKVADEQLIMPHKSTYFYPKILTGLLINKLNS